MLYVSIPFKRETIYKGLDPEPFRTRRQVVSIPFKRESIYKAPSKRSGYPVSEHRVSIPFKRESIYKGKRAHPRVLARRKFQFPSNGKAYTKREKKEKLQTEEARLVSIPFKRESIYKAIIAFPHNYINLKNGFNSLQTGKHIQRSLSIVLERWGRVSRFNSLQTGKHIQSIKPVLLSLFSLKVSIPFKRETIYKEDGDAEVEQDADSFNSLQTGRHIQSIFFKF